MREDEGRLNSAAAEYGELQQVSVLCINLSSDFMNACFLCVIIHICMLYSLSMFRILQNLKWGKRAI